MPKAPRARFALALLVLLNVLNYADRQLVSALGVPIERDLGLNHAELGLLYGYAFILVHTLAAIYLGTLADRFDRGRIIAGGLFVWSAATVASGFTRTFLALGAARVLVGVGEAALGPAALALLADLYPPQERAKIAGWFQGGIPVGVILAALVAAALEPAYGWRVCFFLLGGAGIVASLAMLTLRDAPRAVAVAARGSRELVGELAMTLRRSRALLWVVLGGTLLVYEHSARGLLIVWLQTERGFDLRTATLRAGTMSLVAGLLGSVLGGMLADRVESRFRGGRLRLLAWCQLLFGPAAWAMLRLDPRASPLAFHLTWFVAVAGTMMAYGPVLAEVQDLAPARIRSTALAFFLMVSNLLGAGLGPLATGAIGDRRSLTDGFLVSVIVGTASLPFLLAAARARRRETPGTGAAPTTG